MNDLDIEQQTVIPNSDVLNCQCLVVNSVAVFVINIRLDLSDLISKHFDEYYVFCICLVEKCLMDIGLHCMNGCIRHVSRFVHQHQLKALNLHYIKIKINLQ